MTAFSEISIKKAAETVRQHVRAGETPHRACNWVLGAFEAVPGFLHSDEAFVELAEAAGFQILRGAEAQAATGYRLTCVGTVEALYD